MVTLTRRAVLSALPAPAFLAALPAQEKRKPLRGDWSVARIASALLPRKDWNPLPTARDRGAWEGLPADVRGRIMEAAEAAHKQPWASLPASVYMDFARDGNRSRYEAIRFRRRGQLNALALGECVEGKGRFLDSVLNGVWLVCEESSWVLPAHIGVQKAGKGLPDVAEPVVDLFAAECGAEISWIHYLLGGALDRVSPLVTKRMQAEVRHRVLTPCLERNDFGWMGLRSPEHSLNNWNPWINSNWLTCALLMEDDGQRRAAHVEKSLRSLDEYLSDMPEDGGCDEGPGYWGRAGASLFDCLELLDSASAGKMTWWNDPLVREMGRYIVKAHIAGNWLVNFADASAHSMPDGALVWRYGKAIGDRDMMQFGAYASRDRFSLGTQDSPARALMMLFHTAGMKDTPARAPLLQESWLPKLNVLMARREAGSEKGFYLAAKGGHNAESHNHNDVGNFIVFLDGTPVLVDVGVETYTAKTFSSSRYEIWTMQSGWHNCPTVNGQMQAPGRQRAARDVQYHGGEVSELSMDIAAAYPPEARLDSWRRTLRLDRKADALLLADEWKMKQAGPVEWNFITPVEPSHSAGQIQLAGGAVLHYDAAALAGQVDSHDASDPRLRSVWNGTMYRVRLAWKTPQAEGRTQFRISRGAA